METRMSEKPCILVLGGDELAVRTTVDALRQAGWEALGTSDPWEAILLVSRRTFSLIIQDPLVRGFGDVDLEHILEEDPVLKDVPRIVSSTREELLEAVQNVLAPRIPAWDPPVREATRFFRRLKPAPALH